MRSICLPILAVLAALCLHYALGDVSQLVRSGNGFLYDVPKVTELELEINNEFPTGEEFPQDAIPLAPSDAELGAAESSDVSVASTPAAQPSPHVSHGHGYKYQAPSKRFTS